MRKNTKLGFGPNKGATMRTLLNVMVTFLLVAGTATTASAACDKKVLKANLSNPTLVKSYATKHKACSDKCTPECAKEINALVPNVTGSLPPGCTWDSPEVKAVGLVKGIKCAEAKKDGDKPASPTAEHKPKAAKPKSKKKVVVTNTGAIIHVYYSHAYPYILLLRALNNNKSMVDVFNNVIIPQIDDAKSESSDPDSLDIFKVAFPNAVKAIQKFMGVDLIEAQRILRGADKSFKLLGCDAKKCKDDADKKMLAAFNAHIAKQDSAIQTLVKPYMDKAKAGKNPHDRLMYLWAAVSQLEPSYPNQFAYLTTPSDLGIKGGKEVSLCPAGGCIVVSPDRKPEVSTSSRPGDRMFVLEGFSNGFLGTGFGGAVGPGRLADLIGGNGNWFSRNIPAIRIMLTPSWFWGSDSDHRFGKDWNRDVAGYTFGGSVGVEGALHRWGGIALFMGADLNLTYVHLEGFETERINSKKVTADYFTVGLQGRLGVNLWDWASVYALGEYRPDPVGGCVGAGVELTGLAFGRVAFEAVYDLNNSGVYTDAPESSPLDYGAFSLRLKVGWVN